MPMNLDNFSCNYTTFTLVSCCRMKHKYARALAHLIR